MKATVADQGGTPDVLCNADVPTPGPASHELWIRIERASLSATGVEMLAGMSFFGRSGGLRR